MSGGRRLCPGADGEVSRICARLGMDLSSLTT